MKKIFLMLSLVVVALIFFASCSKDNDSAGNGTDENAIPQCWAMYDGNFLTDEDVVVSADTDNIQVSRTMFKHTFGDKEMKKGDVVGLYKNGILTYLHITDLDNSGSTYVSCDVEQIDLQQVVDLCQVDLGNIRLSTEFYMDPTQPKRVNNSGEADANGIINTECYIEKSSDGTTIYHPIAMAVPAYYNGENGTTDGEVVPGGFVGCYIGQIDQDVDDNSWSDFWSGVSSRVKKIGKAIIAPVQTCVKVAEGAGEAIKTCIVGGRYGFDENVIQIDKTFDGQTFTLEYDPNGEADDDEDSTMYTKDEWENTIKGKLEVTLEGKLKANAGAYMDLEVRPGCNLQKFRTGVHADADVDLNTTVAIGIEGNAERPVIIHKFDYKTIAFSIGPIPILIVIYPELIWKTNFTGEVAAYVTFNTKYQMNCDAHVDIAPKFDATATGKTPLYENTLEEFGLKGTGEVRSGIYVRTSWELYGFSGPVLDIGASLSAEGEGKVFAARDDQNKDGFSPDVQGHFAVNANVGDVQVSFAIKFPPLKDKWNWLYNKLSWESGYLICIDPFRQWTLWDSDKKGEDTDDNAENKEGE